MPVTQKRVLWPPFLIIELQSAYQDSSIEHLRWPWTCSYFTELVFKNNETIFSHVKYNINRNNGQDDDDDDDDGGGDGDGDADDICSIWNLFSSSSYSKGWVTKF